MGKSEVKKARCQNCDLALDMRPTSLPEGAYTADVKGPYCWGCLDEAQEVEDRNAEAK